MTDIAAPTTLTVSVGADRYEFKIPNLYDEIRIGARMAEIRRVIDPNWDGFNQQLDFNSMYALRASATFDSLLVKASARWAFDNTPDGPKVNSANFPADKVNDVLQAYQGFTEELGRFREGRNSDNPPATPEAVAGQ